MRVMMVFGGLVGFSIGLAFGLANASPWPSIIWRASFASLAAGLLMRWWGRVWMRSLREAQIERAEKLEAAQEGANTKL